MKGAHVRIWLQQIRAPFLILAVVLVLIGISVARWEGDADAGNALLLLVGVVLAHASANLFNELSDSRTGIDCETRRTLFSGGSGMLQAGNTSARAVTLAAYGTLFAAAAIGFYFCLASGWLILGFMICGGLAIRFYTSHFARWGIGEAISGITLGSLVVLGTRYALGGRLSWGTAWISVPAGILTSLLLFLNEFPDMEADQKGGRRHLVIQYGRRRSSRIYIAGLVSVYAVILAAPFVTPVPHTVLFALLSLPLAARAGYLAFMHYDDPVRMIPVLALNVTVVILTDFLLAAGFFFGSRP
jgi:1,4-dihydroxy-2-naphthoate polyprenyltransferase